MDVIKYRPTEKRPLTSYEQKALFAAELSTQDRVFVYILYGCGLRRGEALPLTKFDVDLKRRTLTVNKAIGFVNDKPVPKGPKTDNGYRTVPIPAVVFPVIEAYVKSLKRSQLFVMRNGQPITKSSYDKMWARIINFEIHQIIHLKRYRFFDIGNDHYYYDDYANETGMNEVAERSYIPALNTLIEMAKNSGGAFKVALSISGVALEQLEIHAPAVIDLLHQLNETGCCEFLCEPYSHGLSSLANEDCFREEVLRQRDKMKQMFGKEPKVFRNSSLIYSDEIGGLVASMGFKGMLTEGAKHVLGWKSPHYVYHCNQASSLKLLLRDFKLSDDISLRFSNSDWAEYPLFADKYINWIDALPQEEQVINIFMELSALGMAQPLSSNILEFMKALPECAKAKGITFSTPTEIVTKLKSVSQLDVAYPMSWVDEERDTSCWLGNVMQREAFNKLYSVAERVHLCDDRRIKQDWDYLQASNNFRFMTTKNNGMWLNRGIYDSPYDAFTNYMNILGDFIKRVDALYPVDVDSEELNSLLTTIKNQGDEITELEKVLAKLQAKVEAAKKTAVKKATNAKEPVVKEAPATKSKPAAKKAEVKKATAESKKSTGKAKKAAVK